MDVQRSKLDFYMPKERFAEAEAPILWLPAEKS